MIVTCTCGARVKVSRTASSEARCPHCDAPLGDEVSESPASIQGSDRPGRKPRRKGKSDPSSSVFTVPRIALGVGLLVLLLFVAGMVWGVGKWSVMTANRAVNRLASTDSRESEQAERALEKLGRRALPSLRDGLKDSRASVRAGCGRLIGKLGPAAQKDVPEIARLVQDDPDAGVQVALIGAIQELGPVAVDALPSLHRAVSCGNERVERTAIEALGVLADQQAIPHLLAVLRGTRVGHHVPVIAALGKIGPHGPDVVPELTRVMEGNAGLRAVAIEALGNFGPAAVKAVPGMIGLLENDAVSSLVVRALGKIGPGAKDAIPALEKLRDSLVDRARARLFQEQRAHEVSWIQVRIGNTTIKGQRSSVINGVRQLDAQRARNMEEADRKWADDRAEQIHKEVLARRAEIEATLTSIRKG